MKIEATTLWATVTNILNKGSDWVIDKQTMLLHTKVGTVKITQLMSMDTDRDYQASYMDVTVIRFKMTLGEYRDKLHPYKHNLECSMMSIDDPSTMQRYKAVFTPDNLNMDSTKQGNFDTETLDIGGLIDVSLQLIDRVIEPMRMKTTGGVYKKVMNTDIIKGLFYREFGKLQVTDSTRITAIDIAPPQNILPVNQCVIPHGTKLMELPVYLQLHGTGIYAGGINTYVQRYKDKTRVFVYPTFNYDRYDTERPRASFFAIPDTATKLTERTWIMKDGNLQILVTNKRTITDDGESTQMDEGIGFKCINATMPMSRLNHATKMYPPDGDRDIVGDISKNIIGNSSKVREDGLMYSPLYKATINPYKYQSVNNRKLGIYITFSWLNSTSKDIYPGMPCSYTYYNDSTLMKLQGVVSKIYTVLDREGRSNSMVTLFLKRPIDTTGL